MIQPKQKVSIYKHDLSMRELADYPQWQYLSG